MTSQRIISLLADLKQAWYLLGPVTRFQGQSQVEYEISGVRLVVEDLDDGHKVSMKSNVKEPGILSETNCLDL